MFSNIWFWIAVVELAIVLILVLLSRTHHKVQPTNQMARGKPRRDKNSVSKQTGTITNIYHGFMYFGTKPVTCIEVTLSGGDRSENCKTTRYSPHLCAYVGMVGYPNDNSVFWFINSSRGIRRIHPGSD